MRVKNLMKMYNRYVRFYDLGGEIFEMEDFNQILDGLTPLEIIKQVDGDFDVHAPYVYHNSLQWESLDTWDTKMVVEQQLYGDFIEWVVDNDEISIYTVEELLMEERLYDDMNSNVYDLIDNYARVGYDALERMINEYELYECNGYYYLEYVG